MDYSSVEELKVEGFVGFKIIVDLFVDVEEIPNQRGIYLVLWLEKEKPTFVAQGVAGFFKGKDPNVSIEELTSKWVDKTIVVYIGQAGGIRKGKWSNSTLCERLNAYLQFGQGEDIGHYGGRYIWQIKEYKKLVVCWKSLPKKVRDPKELEGKMIKEFRGTYGKRPFANIIG